ncbi:MAG: hypothetical protein IJB49_06845 [Clostridia bacterium]|nr:hypothetical protein [Clostridia bacterium]
MKLLTLDEARRIQKSNTRKVVLKFVIFVAIVAAATYALYAFTDMFERSSFYYVIPALAVIIAIKLTDFYRIFTPKEVFGEALKIDIYSADERKVKRGGFGALQDRFFEAELMVRSESGKVIFRIYRNGDATSVIAEGDKIALLRLVDEPVIIEGKNLKTKI